MSFALTLSSLVAPLVLGSTPVPCPEGQAPAPAAIVEGAAPTCVAALVLPSTPTKASADDIARYAELEQKTPDKVSDFQGGSVAVYVSTGAAIVLVVVLLLILL